MNDLLGAHVSAAGGTPAAPPRAGSIKATAMQIFTKQGNRWAERECDDCERDEFRAALARTGVEVTIAHDSYLINLASPDDTLRRKSIESFVCELKRCASLGLSYLVSHPGNYMDERESGIARNADSITEALARAPGETTLCLETTAGSGTSLGATFEELADIIGRVPEPYRSRIGVCVDTCHVYSAGYDLVDSYDDVWKSFDSALGWERLGVMHLNDSKTPFNSHRDRHALIGFGSLGEEPFRRIMTDPRLTRVAKVLETPKLDNDMLTDSCMLHLLRGFAAG
ncbi:MAG: deoxyribonuclease IV [Gemmatimonadaceae bacterium]|nr:deoxyribonuclease IV [Gemmatimonadaceae bacterium]